MQLDPDAWASMLFIVAFMVFYVVYIKAASKNKEFVFVVCLLCFIAQTLANIFHSQHSIVMLLIAALTFFGLVSVGWDLGKEKLALH